MEARRLVAGAVVLSALLASGQEWRADAQMARPMKPQADVIESRSQTTDSKTTDREPANKKEPDVQTRQSDATCDILFANATGWYIHRVYVDRRRVGSIGRNSEAVLRDEVVGPTELYAEADFIDGPTRTWGPRVFECRPNSTYTWRLFP